MNTNLSKQLEILNACKEGAVIQVKHRDNNSTWRDIKNNHIFNFEDNEYCIKSILPKNWKEYCDNNTRTDKFFIDENSCIVACTSTEHLNIYYDKNLCDSDAEAQAFLALMQLRLLRKAYVGYWKADFTNGKPKCCICNICNSILISTYNETNHCLSFPNKELAQQFLDNFKSIIEIAKPLI